MPKISNKEEYPNQSPLNAKDYFPITDFLTKKTKTVTVESIQSGIVDGGSTTTLPNTIISGRASWDQLMQYITTVVISRFNDAVYTTASASLTLDPASATLNRYDLITLKLSDDASNVYVRVIKGDEALNPVVPTLEYPATEQVLTIVSIGKGATQPEGTSNILVYDELEGEPNEFAVTENTGASGIVLDNTEHPKNLTKSIKINYALLDSGDLITMSSSEDYSVSDLGSLDFWAYVGTEVSAKSDTGDYATFKIYNGANQVGSEVRLRDGYYGLNTSLLNTHQFISIPISDFIIGSGISQIPDYILNKITIGFVGTIGTELFLDTFKLVSGVTTPIQSLSYKGLTDTLDSDFVGKEGYTPIVRGENLKLEKAVTSTDIWGANGKIDAGVIYTGTGLEYYVWGASWIVDNERYDIVINEVVTLDVGDANPRFDVFAIEMSDGVPSIIVKKGDHSVNPLEPSLDLEEQVKVGLVLVGALATDDKSTILSTVYNENSEWTNNVASASVSLVDTDPYSGSLNVSLPKSSTIQPAQVGWVNGSTLAYSSDSYITFAIKNNSNWTSMSGVKIYIKNGGVIVGVSKYTRSTLAKFGFVNSTNAYVLISIPITEFNVNSLVYDGLEFAFLNTDIIKLDLISIQGGIIEPPISATSWLNLNDTENSYSGKAGYVPTVRDDEKGLYFSKKDLKNTTSDSFNGDRLEPSNSASHGFVVKSINNDRTGYESLASGTGNDIFGGLVARTNPAQLYEDYLYAGMLGTNHYSGWGANKAVLWAFNELISIACNNKHFLWKTGDNNALLAGFLTSMELEDTGQLNLPLLTPDKIDAGSPNGAITREYLENHWKVKVDVNSAEILTSFTTPVELIPAPGAGKAINVLSAVINLSYGTSTYAIAGNYLYVYVNGAFDKTNSFFARTTTLLDTVSKIEVGTPPEGHSEIIENSSILLSPGVSDPTLGDSTITIHLTYEVITL